MKTKTYIPKNKLSIIAIIILATLLFSGCKKAEETTMTVPPNAKANDIINFEPCIYERRDIQYTADCGLLIVPENRADPDSRLISLPITRVRATGNNPTEPVFYLPGGPGAANTGTSNVDWFIDNHDIVFIGNRGVDGSVQLDCPEISQHIKNLPSDMLGKASMDNMTNAYARCAERLQNEGIDLDGYTLLEVVDDLESARIALNYEKTNLYSISYGTRAVQFSKVLQLNSPMVA